MEDTKDRDHSILYAIKHIVRVPSDESHWRPGRETFASRQWPLHDALERREQVSQIRISLRGAVFAQAVDMEFSQIARSEDADLKPHRRSCRARPLSHLRPPLASRDFAV